ncbi:hypothetical protein C4K37_1138 [Pseudomonas chlororaphis subsp. piscium]|nr:hypothetical protein C4K37_1138 [Pseudomonas chlororaphis subsp. piscium]AZC42085.1 hypothetical protein C4K36_1141 [Pseudomonas chlororaphis subsp. piscium]AZC61634.1 hypothetical protein C4K33_1123 [Pseudomonas chlororaphis subsp. piscium]AZC67876.1 hypothetical protein C4K32_1195 [Pseudomonas chlororaphis subsp. piscium]AZC93879.1 hypothetical protein C4K28_1132 [Pseudomonas chlororaphis subsp. piscium]
MLQKGRGRRSGPAWTSDNRSCASQLRLWQSLGAGKSFRERRERRSAVSGQRAAPGAYVST